jgi:hypothetical protein
MNVTPSRSDESGGRSFDDLDTLCAETVMTFTQLLLSELDREAPRTRRALEQVPLDRDDWTPHPKSMPLARLAGLVASMPSWIGLIIEQDELNLTPPPGQSTYQQPATNTLVAVHDGHVQKAREVLSRATDEFLMTTNWRLLAGGHVVMLRLNGQVVPAIYGPSADDQSFA